MAIRLRDVSEFVVSLGVAGLLDTAATDLAAQVVPFTGYLTGIYVKAGTAPTKGSGGTTYFTIDINKNGTSIFGSTKLAFPSASQTPTYVAPATNPTAVSAGDVFTMDIDAVVNGTSPTHAKNLGVVLRFSRRLSAPAATELGDFLLDV